MSDLIDRQQAIDALEGHREKPSVLEDDYGFGRREMLEVCIDEIEELPTAQPERKTGHWEITDAYPHNVYCGECHKKFAQTHWAVWEDGSLPRNYCPNCGAKME